MAGLIERRVPHVLVVYLGASWGLVQFIDFLVSRYALSPLWTDLTLLALGLLIPSVILFTYNHGRPGKDRITRSDLIGIPLNIAVMAVVLILVFRDRDLGAVVTSVTTMDEAGQTVQRTVPRTSFRRRLVVFNFEGAADDSVVAWLRYGVPIGVLTDLSQDMFIEARPAAAFRERLRQLGQTRTVDIPATLKRSLAEEHHLPYYTDARMTRNGEEITVDLSLYEATRAEPVQRHSYVERDVFALIDRISADLRTDLGTPSSAESRDLPVAEVMTSSLPAFRHYMSGVIAAETGADWAQATAQVQRAVEIDATFAVAWLTLHNLLVLSGGPDAMAPLQKAMDHLYRLPERAQFDVKSQYYLLRQEHDKALAVLRMKVDLYPDDLGGYAALAQIQSLRRDVDGQIASYQKILELDPMQAERLREIGRLYESKGDFDTALRYYTQYAERYPDRPEAFQSMGSMYRLQGNLAQAKSQFEKALLLANRRIDIVTSLAAVERDQGNFDTALRSLEEALADARTPEERARVQRALSDYHEYRGQLLRSLEYTRQALREDESTTTPLQVALTQLLALDQWVRAGRTAEARRLFAEASRSLQPPLTLFAVVAEMNIALESGDSAAAARAIAAAEQGAQQFGLQVIEPMIALGRGRLAELRRDYAAAITEYEKHLALMPTSPRGHVLIGRCLRLLGQPQKAIEQFHHPLRVQPYSPVTNHEAGLAWLDAGDRTKALEHLERAISVWNEADAGYTRAAEAKAKLDELRGRN